MPVQLHVFAGQYRQAQGRGIHGLFHSECGKAGTDCTDNKDEYYSDKHQVSRIGTGTNEPYRQVGPDHQEGSTHAYCRSQFKCQVCAAAVQQYISHTGTEEERSHDQEISGTPVHLPCKLHRDKGDHQEQQGHYSDDARRTG
ncbi:hypothetical protein FQZ97_773230 [compost metagenome]